MRLTLNIDKNTDIVYKLVAPSNDKLNIRYRAWLEITDKVYEGYKTYTLGNEIWFYDEESLDNMINELTALRDALQKERDAIDNRIDAIESIAKVC